MCLLLIYIYSRSFYKFYLVSVVSQPAEVASASNRGKNSVLPNIPRRQTFSFFLVNNSKLNRFIRFHEPVVQIGMLYVHIATLAKLKVYAFLLVYSALSI